MAYPILAYGAEVWEVYDTSVLDRVPMKFYKRILGIKFQTSNIAVYGVLGCYLISIICQDKVSKYKLKVISEPFYYSQCFFFALYR